MDFAVRFAGIGGQGAITAGKLFAEALGADGRLYVAQTSAYGAAVRDGPAASDVRMSDGPVVFPWVFAPDCLVAFHQRALDAHVSALKPGGVLIADPLLVTAIPDTLDARVYRVPMTELAQQAGRRVVGNVVGVAAVARITGLVGRQALEQVLVAQVPKGTEPLNLRALALGFEFESDKWER